MASCTVDGDEQTAQILDGQSGTIAVVGDVSQTDGSMASFTDCYEPTWGRHKARTRPAPGNHDYRTPGAAPYYEYFGAAAGPPGQGWYSYDLGAWHIVSLNSNCLFVDCEAGSPQEQWLRADLAAHPAACTLAYWHHPRFSSGRPLQIEELEPLWAALYEAGAEIVLSGHDHIYERFAPQTPIGDPSPAYGIREFIVGTGGFGHSGLQPVPLPLSTVRNNDTLGVLRLTLDPTGYAWTFLPVAGATFSDSGIGVCHDAQADVTPPTTDLTLPSPDVVVSGLQMLAADAFDGPLNAARVDFLIGQTIVATDTTRPFAFQWDTTSIPDGARILKARGVDAAGNASTSARGIVIDNADPDTTITNGPTGTVRTYAPVFYLRSEPGATFTLLARRPRVSRLHESGRVRESRLGPARVPRPRPGRGGAARARPGRSHLDDRPPATGHEAPPRPDDALGAGTRDLQVRRRRARHVPLLARRVGLDEMRVPDAVPDAAPRRPHVPRAGSRPGGEPGQDPRPPPLDGRPDHGPRGLAPTRLAAGGVPERPKGTVLKTVGRASVPWVRIPPPPLSGPCGGDGFQSGVDAEGPKETTDVVPDRLRAQVELGGDLLRRAALLQQTEHLDLTGREMWVRRCGPVVGAFLEQPEDADHPFTVHERHRADVHGHPGAGARNQDAGRIGGRGGAEHLPGEQLAGAAAVLGRDDGREVATANVADQPLGCRIDPANDSRRVEDVAGDADALQRLLDVAAECQAGGHHGSVAYRRAARHSA